jgi:hypothetical protein
MCVKVLLGEMVDVLASSSISVAIDEDLPGFFERLSTGSGASSVISAFYCDPRPILPRVAL